MWGDAWHRLKKNRIAMVCLGLVVVFTVLAIYAEGVHQYYLIKDITPPYSKMDLAHDYDPPSLHHWMGTNGMGQDVMARLVQGVRIAYKVGIVTVSK